jgi:hypothetical protein
MSATKRELEQLRNEWVVAQDGRPELLALFERRRARAVHQHAVFDALQQEVADLRGVGERALLHVEEGLGEGTVQVEAGQYEDQRHHEHERRCVQPSFEGEFPEHQRSASPARGVG